MSFFNPFKPKKPRESNKNSKFWLDLDSMGGKYDVLTGKMEKTPDLVRLISIRNSIANFVRIVTGQNIPVKYSSGAQSYTDGKTVVLSSKIDDTNYDPTVGLALHEASHVLLTDFSTLPKLMSSPPMDLVKRVMAERKMDVSAARSYVSKYLKDLINIIEDRRIDNYIFKNAPGYKGYYHSLYEKYFNDTIIDIGLMSTEYRLETWNSYLFRIGNMTNPNRDLSALKGLQKIWDMIDIKNIGRFDNTKQIVALSEQIFDVIEDNITNEDVAKEKQEQQQTQDQKNKNRGMSAPQEADEDPTDNLDPSTGEEESDDEQESKDGKGKPKKDKKDPKDKKDKEKSSKSQGDSESPEEEEKDEDAITGDGKEEGEEKDGESDSAKSKQTGAGGKAQQKKAPKVMDQNDFEKLKDAIKKQEKFNEGKLDKEKLNDIEASKLEAVEKAEAHYANVAKDIARNKVDGVRVLVAKKLTKALIDSQVFGHTLGRSVDSSITQAINKGMRMGAMLGKKLQVRQEARDTKFTRQNVGKIDRRLIASIGTGLENVFEQTFVTKFNPSIVHITIDASGSMDGDKFEKSIACAVAIAKACSMIENMNCVISFRATETSGGEELPSVLIAYDSRIDSINKITSLFGYLRAATSTPEGLCFEAIMKLIPAGGATLNSYFINFSDGEPGFSNQSVSYSGDTGLEHTKRQVAKLREKNIKVLSYYIGSGHGHSGFVRMYGKDAEFIDTNSIPLVAKTMNAKFLEA